MVGRRDRRPAPAVGAVPAPRIQLEALIEALHNMVQRKLPITMVGAGLPQIAELARAELINMGLLYTPRHGYAAFTVPHFDRFLRRAILTLTVPELKTRRSRPTTPEARGAQPGLTCHTRVPAC